MPDDTLYSVNGELPYVRKLGPGSWKGWVMCEVIVGGTIGKGFWEAGTTVQIVEQHLEEVNDETLHELADKE